MKRSVRTRILQALAMVALYRLLYALLSIGSILLLSLTEITAFSWQDDMRGRLSFSTAEFTALAFAFLVALWIGERVAGRKRLAYTLTAVFGIVAFAPVRWHAEDVHIGIHEGPGAPFATLIVGNSVVIGASDVSDAFAADSLDESGRTAAVYIDLAEAASERVRQAFPDSSDRLPVDVYVAGRLVERTHMSSGDTERKYISTSGCFSHAMANKLVFYYTYGRPKGGEPVPVAEERPPTQP